MNDLIKKYITVCEDANGVLQSISFTNNEKFNFAYDIVDELARIKPQKRAMLYVDKDKNERNFTFGILRCSQIKQQIIFPVWE